MTMDIATLGIRVDATEARLAAVELDRLGAAGGRTATSMSSVERASKNLMGVFAGLGLGAFAKDILATNREMESLRASLLSVTGSSRVATSAFDSMKQLAKETPFEIKGLTQSFVVLQNMGIKPTHQVMDALTNQAAKLGGHQETLTSIVMQLGQAHSKGKLQMQDMHILMERGVPVMKLLAEVTGKNSAELMKMSEKGTLTNDIIDKMIIKMGELAAGSNTIAMNTLNGKISSLSDAWHDFEDTLMGDTSEGFIKKIVGNWTEWLDFFKDSIAGVGKEFAALEEINNKIVTSKAKISAMSQGGVAGAAWTVAGALTGNSVAGEENRLASFIKQREGIIKTTHDVIVAKNEEKAATDKLLNSAVEEKKVLQESSEAKKAAEKAAKEAAKAQEALAKSFADTLESLSLHNIELSKTPREHKEAELYAKKYTDAMVAQAMAIYDIGTALEAKKKLHEAEKSELDSLIDKYKQLTLSARDYKLTQLNAQGITGSAEQAPIMAQFDNNANAEAAKKTTDDATASLDAYNKKLDDANTKTSDLGAVTSAIFDGALGGISAMAGAFDSMVTSMEANTKALEENAAMKKLNESTVDPVKKAANFKTYAKEEAKLNNDNTKAALTGASQIAGAAANLFDKKSNAAKAFHNIEMGLSVLRLAMDIKEMASSMMKTGVNVGEGASKMFGQSGWYGFAGVAAMMAVMAGLGFAGIGGGGGGGASGPPPSNSDMGTGTVLGDPTAKSESINHTNDLLQNIHAEEYLELRGINKGVQALSGSITSAVTKQFQLGAIQGVNAPNLGKSGHTMVAGGLQTGEITLGDLLKGNSVFGQMYTTDAKKGGSKEKPTYSYQDYLSPMAAELQKSLTDVFKNIGKTFDELSTKLGPEFSKKIKDTIVPALKIDTMGLSGKDAVDKANAVISSTLDKVSAVVFSSLLKYQQLGEGMYETAVRIDIEKAVIKDAFSQSGKAMPKVATDAIAMADALVQASGGIEKFQSSFATFMDKFTTDAEKQTRTETFLKGSGTPKKHVAGALNEGFNQVSVNRMLTSRDAYGDEVDAAAARVSKYAGKTDNKSIAAEKKAVAQYSLLLEMAPKVDEYLSYKENLAKDTLDMNIKLYQSQGDGLKLSKEIAKSHAEELKLLPKSLRGKQQAIWDQELINKQTALSNTLMKAQGKTGEALADSRKRELAAMDPSLRATQEAINKQEDLNKTMTSYWNLVGLTGQAWRVTAENMRKELAALDPKSENYVKDSDLIKDTYNQKELNTLKELNIQLAGLEGKSYQALTEQRQKALNALDPTSEAYRTQVKINKQEDFNKTQNLSWQLLELEGKSLQVVNEKRALVLLGMSEDDKLIQRKINSLEDLNTAMTKATSDVTSAMSRLTELSGKLKSTMSSLKVETNASLKIDRANANALLKSTLIIAKMGGAIDNIAGMDKALEDLAKPSEQLYSTFTDYARDQAIASSTISDLAGYADAQVSMAEKQLKAINDTTTAVVGLPEALAKLMGLDAQKKALPQFASGGYHSGGWRVVGENGPELEQTGASRIFSNPQSKGLLSTDELVAELQALRAEVRAGQEAIANNTRQTAKILRDVTQDGQSITTSAVVV